MIPLVGDDFLDDHDRVVGDGGDRLELLGGFQQRRLHRRGVAPVCPLHGDADDRAGVEINGVLGLVRQMRPAVLHLRDLRVGIVWMRPVVVRGLLLPFPIDPRQVGASVSRSRTLWRAW